MVKRKRLVHPAALALGVALAFGCADEAPESELEQQAEATAEEAQRTAELSREALAQRIEDLEREAADLAERTDEVGAEAREEWSETVADLRREAGELRENMNKKGREAWQDFSGRARASIERLEQELDEAAEQLN